MSTINSEVVLGYQLNLIKGIKPEWDTLRGRALLSSLLIGQIS